MAPASSKPFRGEYDHIVRDAEDNYFEMTCRICRDNCSPHPPYSFIDSEGSINLHFSTSHGDAKEPSTSEEEDVNGDGEIIDLYSEPIAKVEGNIRFRKLRLGAIHLIEAGRGEEMIKKRTLATKSTPPKYIIRPTSMPFKDNPTVFRMGDGSLIQLECGECGGTSHDKKGSMGKPKAERPQEFIYGIRGLKGHLTNGHQLQIQDLSNDEIAVHHGRPLQGNERHRVENDRSGGSIGKIRVQATGQPSRTKAKKAKKGKVIDSSTTDETEVGEDACEAKSEEYVLDDEDEDEEEREQEAAATDGVGEMGDCHGEPDSESERNGISDDEPGLGTVDGGEDEGGEVDVEEEGEVGGEVDGDEDEEEYGVEPPLTPVWARENFHGTFGP